MDLQLVFELCEKKNRLSRTLNFTQSNIINLISISNSNQTFESATQQISLDTVLSPYNRGNYKRISSKSYKCCKSMEL